MSEEQLTELTDMSKAEVQPAVPLIELSEEQKIEKSKELGLVKKQKQEADNDIKVLSKFAHIVENASYYGKDMQTLSYGIWFLNRVVDDATSKVDALKVKIKQLEEELK